MIIFVYHTLCSKSQSPKHFKFSLSLRESKPMQAGWNALELSLWSCVKAYKIYYKYMASRLSSGFLFAFKCWAAKPGRSERGQNKAARPAAKNLDRCVGRPKHRRTAKCTASPKTDGHFGGQIKSAFLIKRNEKFSNITYKSLTSNQEK
ncbi:hypothetical protein BpHYR1_031963 [Brachionus plicatilis]|uniref:Uncharacterized protein n=1 Tax=Brachionus plicatilis TaxID=10195 RepID=A0A3M7QX23_BRAPC|nr:hypothetical protein BpHYR1_031963 [Brachionus plicatilis]